MTNLARRRLLLSFPVLTVLPRITHAHDYRIGAMRIDHPYAVPSNGQTEGKVYFRALHNRGRQDERLLGASTERAERVQLVGDHGNEVKTIEISSGQRLGLLHSQPAHLRLVGLTEPLHHGQRFLLTLEFEQAGQRTVRVDVQQPRSY